MTSHEIAARYREKNRDRLNAKSKVYRTTFKHFLQRAKYRKLEIGISQTEWQTLVQQLCHYCGNNGQNGVDRVNNDFGYIQGNCVACCAMCNRMRGRLTQSEFYNKIGQIMGFTCSKSIGEPK